MILFNKIESEKIFKYCFSAYLDNSFWSSPLNLDFNNLYGIFYKDAQTNNKEVPIGVIQVSIKKYKNGKEYAVIDMLELFENYRGKGYFGKEIIKSLFKRPTLGSIEGYSIPSAVYFWYNIGANFFDNASLEELEEEIEDGNFELPFKLTRGDFNKATSK